MPVEYTKITGENQIIGLWRLEEEEKEVSTTILSSSQAAIKGYRKTHTEACRELIKAITGYDKIKIIKDKFGKPHIKDSSSHISFSHSGDYAAAIYNNVDPVGIDVQEMKGKIVTIAPKFTSEREYEYISSEHQIRMLHVIWGAKEAMFKKYGKGGVLFKEHIYVHPFTCMDKGYITVSFLKENQEETSTFKYQFYENYCLVYSTCHL